MVIGAVILDDPGFILPSVQVSRKRVAYMTLDGRIVEYLENGKFICAYVCEDKGSRLRLLNQSNREINLPQNRIIHWTAKQAAPGSAREEIVSILKKTSQQRAELAQATNLVEIWEVVSENPEKTFSVNFLAGLFWGDNPTDDQCAAFIRSVISKQIYFKYKSGTIHVHSPETVAQLKLNRDKEKEEENFIARNTLFLSHLRQNDDSPQDWPDRDTILQLLADYYLFGKEAPGFDLARKLVKNTQLNGPHDIFHLLVKAGVWDKNQNIPLLRKDIPTSFSEAALAEAEGIKVLHGADMVAAGRKDLRDLSVMTIDGPDTRDFDDGLHIEMKGENYLVGIHISDVGLYFKQGSALFAEALTRVTSIYFHEKQLPMLPPILSEEKFSLRKGQDRPALSFLVLLSPTAEVLKFEVVSSIVSVKRQLTYPAVDKLIKEDRELAALAALSVLLRQRRVNRGALLLPIPDLHISFKADDSLEITRSPVDTPSRILVAEFMILANTLGAQFLADREVPGLFRSQPEPRQRLIDGFEKDIIKVLQQRKRLSPM